MNEQMYLVCEECGEAFDEIATAAGHDHMVEARFAIRPESEAM